MLNKNQRVSVCSTNAFFFFYMTTAVVEIATPKCCGKCVKEMEEKNQNLIGGYSVYITIYISKHFDFVKIPPSTIQQLCCCLPQCHVFILRSADYSKRLHVLTVLSLSTDSLVATETTYKLSHLESIPKATKKKKKKLVWLYILT